MNQQELHIITRYSRPHYIRNVADSINSLLAKLPTYSIYWHVLVDNEKVGDSHLEFTDLSYNVIVTQVQKQASDPYLHEEMSLYCRNNIKQGWITFIDDDNILHENYVRTVVPYLEDSMVKVIVVHQDVNYADFRKIKIREALPENMAVGGVDLGQLTLHADILHSNTFPVAYTGDSELVEKLYRDNSSVFKFINAVASYYNHSSATTSSFLPTVLYIGESCELIKTVTLYEFSEKYINVIYRKDDSDLETLQKIYNIDLYVSEEEYRSQLTQLPYQPITVRKQWIEVSGSDMNKGNIIYFTLFQSIISRYNKSDLVSIFTSTYNTGVGILKTYYTLKNQTISNWEWTVVDDSTDTGETFKLLTDIARKDPRVKVYKFNQNSNRNIGEAKYRAAMLTTGDILLELDHDDWLLPDACETLLQASKEHPEGGFFYSDCIEIDKAFKSREYGEHWAFGYGKYRTEVHDMFGRREFTATIPPNINPRTIRHIISVPNHLRAWRRSVYFQIGGHNRSMSIVDDYELMLRTFLTTKFVHIEKTLYIQLHTGNNSQDIHRTEISRRVDVLRYLYRDAISARFEMLGIEDWCATEQEFLNAAPRIGKAEGVANETFKLPS